MDIFRNIYTCLRNPKTKYFENIKSICLIMRKLQEKVPPS